MSAWRRVVAVGMALAIGATVCLMPTRADIVFRGGGGAGGAWTGGTVTGASIFTNTVTFGSAQDAANSIALNETVNCITFEGTTADGIETRVCAGNPTTGDQTFTFPGGNNGSKTVAMIDIGQNWLAVQTFQSGLYGYTGVEAVTTTKTPSALAEGNETYTNTGDTDGATITLPDNPTAGLAYHAAVTTAQTLTIVPSAGETLWGGTNQCLVSISSNNVGATLTIRAVVGGSGGMWMVFGPLDDAGGDVWDCNDV